LRIAGLGYLTDDGAVMLEVDALYRLVSTVADREIQPRWDAMLNHAQEKGWTDAERRFVRTHLQRVSTDSGNTAHSDAQAARFRRVLGHFASGVTVVTGLDSDGPAGFSCQSFSSLSLNPPMVLILPGRSSTSWPRIQATGRFCVNILAVDQETLARQFARSGSDKFAGVQWSPGVLGAPRLTGACAWIECEINSVRTGGDHFVVLGDVRALEAAHDVEPLLFHRGQFGRLAAVS
jgi:flavin reductase (DIM6/NTAB) family NADH-FMN oxidoreductase RutF